MGREPWDWKKTQEDNEQLTKALLEGTKVPERDYYVVTVGHNGFFKATCASEAKQKLIDHLQANRNGEPRLTRSQRRYLFNRATACRVS